MTTVRIGDVFELETPKGLAYLQYTHETKSDGALVRVLRGTYPTREPIAPIVNTREQFFAFVPIAASVRQGLVRAVGHHPVPEHARKFPLFKARVFAGLGRPQRWDLWDGDVVTSVPGPLTPEQRALPIREVVTPSLLADRIGEGWAPEDEVGDVPSPVLAGRSAERVSHYAYFEELAHANAAAERLRSSGVSVEVRPAADGSSWALIGVAAADAEDVEQVVLLFGGVYDGYQRSAPDQSTTVN